MLAQLVSLGPVRCARECPRVHMWAQAKYVQAAASAVGNEAIVRKLVALEKYEDALNGDTGDAPAAGDSGDEGGEPDPKRSVNFRVRLCVMTVWILGGRDLQLSMLLQQCDVIVREGAFRIMSAVQPCGQHRVPIRPTGCLVQQVPKCARSRA